MGVGDGERGKHRMSGMGTGYHSLPGMSPLPSLSIPSGHP
jgi:hypothetical protein